MIRKLSLLISAAAALFAVAALSGCNRASGNAGFSMPPPTVTTTPVVIQDVPVYLDEIGKTTASEVVNIIPQVSGKITARYFTDGAELHQGEKLFLIDQRPYQAALDQAQAILDQSQAQLANARTNFDRVASELPSKAVSQQDYDNAKNVVDVASANVKAAQAAIETANLNLEYCSIDSPLEGRASQRLVDAGNVVMANVTSLLDIQKLVPIYVDFTVPENELDRVRANLAKGALKVIVDSPNNPGQSIDGELTFLDNAVQDGTGTIKLRATVPNQDRQLWPGQFVRVRLILTTLKGAMLVPAEALQVGQQGPFVFAVGANNTAEQINVVPGQRQGDLIVIEKGLSGDESIVRSGQMMLNPGVPVVVQKPATQPSAGTGT
jgi:membrane fusion protein, multidrug efflux system